jgi:transposase
VSQEILAARLGRLIYRMLKYGEEYVDKGMAYYEEKYAAQQLKTLRKKAKDLGMRLVAAQEVAS